MSGNPIVKLSIQDGSAMSLQEKTKGERLANTELQNILENTVKEYRPKTGSLAEAFIRQVLNFLKNNPDKTLAPKDFQWIVRTVSEDIHRNQHMFNAHLQAMSIAPRETGRMPTECMMHWLATIDETSKNASEPAKKEKLLAMLADAQHQWLQHKLTFSEAHAFFARAGDECTANGLTDLAGLASQLRTDIPATQTVSDDLQFKTRLHDNIYGRVYDSRFMAELIADPPAGVKRSMSQLGNLLADKILHLKVPSYFDLKPGEITDFRQEHINEIQSAFITEPRAWQNQSPLLKAFINESDSTKRENALEKLLRSPKETGIDCITIPCIAVQAVICNPLRINPTWETAADQNYYTVIQPQNRRILHGENPAQTTDAGITMAHQPSAVKEEWMERSSRPCNHYKPNFKHGAWRKRLPKAVIESLRHGLPFASGVSGSTNLILHMVDDANRKKNMNINMKDVLLATIMFTNFDGGHSLHECLWVANQLDGHNEGQLPLDLQLSEAATPPKQFVSDYTRLFDDSIPAGTSKDDPVKRAAQRAFEQTIQYFKQHSFYATAKNKII